MSIKVYNVSGSQVAIIDSGEYNQGMHEFEWSAEDLPSGIYFLRIMTNKCSGQFHKIVLLK